VDDLRAAAKETASQFEAGNALAVRTDTTCTEGTDNWKIHDPYRSTCHVELMTADAVDISPLPALSGLADRLTAVGWYSTGGWTLTGGRGEVVDFEAWNRHGYRLEDLGSANCGGPHGATLTVDLRTSETPVSMPEPAIAARPGPGAVYFASTDGTNWQAVWTQQQSQHPYVLVLGGSVAFAQQGR